MRLSSYRTEERKQIEASQRAPTTLEPEVLDPEDPLVVVLEHMLSELRSGCVARDVPLLLVRIPYRNEFGESRPVELASYQSRAAYRTTISSIAGRLSIPFLDLSESLQEWKSHHDEPLTFDHDPHWNERGHEAAFHCARPFLNSHLLSFSGNRDSHDRPETQLSQEITEEAKRRQ